MKLIISAFLALIVLCTCASAYTQINIYVDNAGNALFLGQSNVSIKLPSGINLTNGEISGYTSELTSKVGEVWTFSYELNDSELNVIFPQGTVVNTLESGSVYLIGEQIGVYGNNLVRVSYTITPVKESTSSRVWFIVFLGVVFIVGGYLYWFKLGPQKEKGVRKKVKVDKISILKDVLNDREKAILEKLRTTGKIKSSFLRKAIDIPKASFSRHIHELEKKKLVKLSGEGKNKFVELIR